MRKNRLIYKNNDITLYASDIHNANIGKTWSVLNNTHHAMSNINWVEKYTLVYKDTEKAALIHHSEEITSSDAYHPADLELFWINLSDKKGCVA